MDGYGWIYGESIYKSVKRDVGVFSEKAKLPKEKEKTMKLATLKRINEQRARSAKRSRVFQV